MWVDAKGFEGRLQVTKCGLVRSVDRVVYNHPNSTRKLKGRVISGSVGKAGYKKIDLRKKTKGGSSVGKTVLLHRIIALTFIELIRGLEHVNHIDGDRLNNNASNLEWCDHQMNMKHAHSTGLCDSVKRAVICSRGGYGYYYPYMRMTIKDGCNPSLVHAAINGGQKTHRGAVWDYV